MRPKRWGAVAGSSATVVLLFTVAHLWYGQAYPMVPTISSLPVGTGLVVILGSLQTSPFKEQNGLFVANIETGAVSKWEWRGGVTSISPLARIPNLEMLSFAARLEEDTGESLYTLSSEGQFTSVMFWSPFDTDYEHTWSPDARMLVYRKYEKLFILEPDGEVEHLLIDAPGIEGFPDWSPDGGEIVFQSLNYSRYDLYRVAPNGIGLLPVAQDLGGNSRRPLWSPNGDRIAFLHSRGGVDIPYGIWVINRESNEANPVFIPSNPTGESQTSGVRIFDWSPDGQRLLFVSGHEGPCRTWGMDATFTECEERVYIVNRDGTGLRTLNIQPQINYTDIEWIR